MSGLYNELRLCLRNEDLVALLTVITGSSLGKKMLIWPNGRTYGDLGSILAEHQVQERASELLEQQLSEKVSLEFDGETMQVFIEVFAPSPKLIIIGAVHVSIPLITFSKMLGFRTIVVDPRSAFATPKRFAHADQLLVKWPHEALSPSDFNESTYLVVLSHDEKLDNPALKLALDSPCRYIGALGSRKTHARRVHYLKEMGVSDEQLSRIHSPIGLNLGGRRPEEIALATIAQIIAVRCGKL